MVKIGIDLGTTDCYVAAFVNDKVVVFENEIGIRPTPSCLKFTNDKRLIGEEAVQDESGDPYETISGIKRIIGRKATDPVVAKFVVTTEKEYCNKGDKLMVKTGDYDVRGYCPEEIIAILLKKMKKIVETKLRDTVTGAVVTVPASFNEAQQSAILDAAVIAGLPNTKLVHETTAVAAAHAFQSANDDNSPRQAARHCVIYHFGAGSTGASVVRIQSRTVDVLSHAGISNLGGNDLDKIIVQYWIKEAQKKSHSQRVIDKKTMVKIRSSCSNAKVTLSRVKEARVDVSSSHRTFRINLTREVFESETAALLRLALGTVETALRNADRLFTEIDEFIVVGGPAMVMDALGKFKIFGTKRNKRVNEVEAAVIGAALMASNLCGDERRGIVVNDIIDKTERRHVGVDRKRQDSCPGQKESHGSWIDRSEGCGAKGFYFEHSSSITKTNKLKFLATRMEKDERRDEEREICEKERSDLVRFAHRYSSVLQSTMAAFSIAQDAITQYKFPLDAKMCDTLLDQLLANILHVEDMVENYVKCSDFSRSFDALVTCLSRKLVHNEPHAYEAIGKCYEILRQKLQIRHNAILVQVESNGEEVEIKNDY